MFFVNLMTAAAMSCSPGDDGPRVGNAQDHQPAAEASITNTTLNLSSNGGWALVGWTDQHALDTIPTRLLLPYR